MSCMNASFSTLPYRKLERQLTSTWFTYNRWLNHANLESSRTRWFGTGLWSVQLMKAGVKGYWEKGQCQTRTEWFKASVPLKSPEHTNKRSVVKSQSLAITQRNRVIPTSWRAAERDKEANQTASSYHAFTASPQTILGEETALDNDTQSPNPIFAPARGTKCYPWRSPGDHEMSRSCELLSVVASNHQGSRGHIQSLPDLHQTTPGKEEPLMALSFPSQPWTCLSTDLFELDKKTYIVVVDYTSRWFESCDSVVIRELWAVTSEVVIWVMCELFATHGIPDTIVSNNRPHYAYKEFGILPETEPDMVYFQSLETYVHVPISDISLI